MNDIKIIFWTLTILIGLDAGIGLATRYPILPSEMSSIGTLQRYFNYGRSIEGKVRWMTADRNENASGLAKSGWFVREQERLDHAADGREDLVSIYGMSFSSRVGHQLERIDDRFSVRLSGGPGATVGRSYAEYLLDRGQHDASVVVLGILASSIEVTETVTHMTWNFHAPSPHFYPKFRIEDAKLARIDSPANSLDEFRKLLNDPEQWRSVLAYLEEHDPYYDRFSFRTDILDHSVIGRMLRRAYAESSYRRNAARYVDREGFTNYGNSVTLTKRIIQAFVEQAKADGHLPIVALFNDRGYEDYLYRALKNLFEENAIAFVSSHEIVGARDLSKFESDGHFLPQYDREIALRLAAVIDQNRPPRSESAGR